ncbi:MAG: baseplate J/gp47 family protein [Desulfobulbaceae bacterium]|nr:baseplate J/gp47 family protein [Pseudomonadota bacterium]MCG2747001.1 baseplate J/gp47 family protein [Desulfobulbaceae bacterium]
MPITPPRLDDRNFEDLVDELLARVQAHTPEWLPQENDPGRTLLELFAWLGDTILYRANLVPERQRLAFLNLLGKKMRPASAARGLVTIKIDDPEATTAVTLAPLATISGPVNFETLSEVTVFPLTAECYYKRPLTKDEETDMQDILAGLQDFHDITGTISGYVTTPIFSQGEADKTGLDLIDGTTDRSLWIALLAEKADQINAIKDTMAGTANGKQQLLNIGLVPAIRLPESFDETTKPGRIPHVWEISTAAVNEQQKPVYSILTRLADSTDDLTKGGVERLLLPGDPDDFGVLEGDVRRDFNAGVGDRPPRLDDPDKISRIVAWLRLRPTRVINLMALSWAGINVVEIDQRQTIVNRIIGKSDGSAEQVLPLPARSVDPDTFELQVEETDRGYVPWNRVDDLAVNGRDDAVFSLDSEAGTVSFGNGVYGKIPEPARRIRVASMRAGGGSKGNLAPGSLKEITARDLDGKPINRKLKVIQNVATDSGADPETLVEAEKRIPSWLSHRNRSVTAADYKALAAETPGVKTGRIEVLPRFLPQQRRKNVPGVVSVMVLPHKALPEAPNPRPDQPFIEKVYSYLNARRPLATELYVIGVEYIPIGVSIGITIRNGFGYDQVIHNVNNAVKSYLWSLPPAGPQGEGWPLGKTVGDRELEVVIARVAGVNTVGGVNLFCKGKNTWRKIKRQNKCDPIEIKLLEWQLPELLSVVVTTDGTPVDDIHRLPDPFTGGGTGTAGTAGEDSTGGGVAVPVVPEVC